MSFGWLKQYMPRGLYGRAALILLLPVVVLQLVFSVLFAQRHFSDVTLQMTDTTIRELRLVLDTINTAPTPEAVAPALKSRLDGLAIDVRLIAAADIPAADTRRWYDYSGTVFAPVLRQAFPEIKRILLGQSRRVLLYVDTAHGPIEIAISRRQLSAAKPHQLYVYMIFFGVLMTLIAYIYMRNQLRPITKLGRVAEAFGRGRHLPYNPSGATEVRAAGTAFVDMRNRIERHIEQRTLMLSGVSHDLRTPLTRMKLALAFLPDEDRAPLEQDVDEMRRLVDEFLGFVKGAAEGEAEPLDVIAFAERIVEDAQRAGQNVTLRAAKGEGTVPLRETAMRRAVDNLISNAVRYGTKAELSVRLTDKSLRLRVEDDGPGIPADIRQEAMKPFVRLDSARNQDSGAGVGLGLAIATDIARSHGGVLRLGQSERLGGLRADIVIAR